MAHKAKIGESLSERERFCIDAVLFNSDNTDLAYILSRDRKSTRLNSSHIL